jgi:hypothetical protein
VLRSQKSLFTYLGASENKPWPSDNRARLAGGELAAIVERISNECATVAVVGVEVSELG